MQSDRLKLFTGATLALVFAAGLSACGQDEPAADDAGSAEVDETDSSTPTEADDTTSDDADTPDSKSEDALN